LDDNPNLAAAILATVDDTASWLAFVRSHGFDAMTLQKYSRFVDGTIPVPALLYDDEENYARGE